MEKKSVLVVILFLVMIFLISTAHADTNTTIDSSYACLKSQLGNNCGDTTSTQTAAFNLLAMSFDSKVQSDCKKSLNNKKKGSCWPDSSSSDYCSIKSTALAILALKTIGQNVDNSVQWLLNQQEQATGLNWYLEIESTNSTQCSINGVSFTIGDDKKILGSDPSGLEKSYNNYWFRVTDQETNFTISCDNDFLTTLLYQKQSSSTFFVSPQTHTASAGESTHEQVNSFCLTTSTTCDYEGTLWAALALQKAGKDPSSFIPYIVSASDDNPKLIPSAFLYMLNNADDSYYTDLKNLQKQSKYWQESGDKFYDSALVLLALNPLNEAVVSNSKAYLLTQRQDSGCWSSNTPFILYSGWTKNPVVGDTGGSTSACESFNGYGCVSSSECLGVQYTIDMYCPGTSVCCSNRTRQLNCINKQGVICQDNEECTGDIVPAADTSQCCKGSCQLIQPNINECINQGYSCKTACSSNEEEEIGLSAACTNQKCCGASGSSISIWVYIIILIILIIILVVAIIFRDKLKIWFFKMKSGFKTQKGPAPVTRPNLPPPGYRPIPPRPRQMIPRQQMPQSRLPPPRKPRSDKEKDFEETMKKLREMSK